MIYLLYASLAMLIIAFFAVLWRLQRGPSNMDRAVALDVISSASIGISVVVMAITGRIDLLPVLVVFASVGFISSTSIARFWRVDETHNFDDPDLIDSLDDDDEDVHPDDEDDDEIEAEDEAIIEALMGDDRRDK